MSTAHSGENLDDRMRVGSFAGFVMTFRRPGILASTIQRILDQSRPPDFLLVVDNDPQRSAEAVAREFPAETVGYRAVGHNSGPAGAAAIGLQDLAASGYDWIWWCDDDDPPPKQDTLEVLLRLIESYSDSGDDVPLGAVACNGGWWDWERGGFVRIQDHHLVGTQIDLDIFAGNGHPVISRRAIERVGVPDPDLFFGFEDLDYSLRIRKGGFRILADPAEFMAVRRIWGTEGITERPGRVFVPYPRLWRDYYSYRNKVYIMRKVLGRNDFALKVVARAVGKALMSFRLGASYGARASLLLCRAAWDGLRGNLGQTVLPVAKYKDASSAAIIPEPAANSAAGQGPSN